MSSEMKEPKINFEEAMEQLEIIVKKMEKGDFSLDQMLELFQEGMLLSKKCAKKLDEAEMKISLILENEKSEIFEVPFASDKLLEDNNGL